MSSQLPAKRPLSSATTEDDNGTASTEKYAPPKVWKPVPATGAFAAINAPTAGARHESTLPVGQHPLQLYSLATPNGVKVTICLEELVEAIPTFEYDAWLIKIDGPQFGSGFVQVNPNSKIPAMVDRSSDPPLNLFESASILVYLAEKFPEMNFLPQTQPLRATTLNWLFWQMGSAPLLGGGFGHFFAYAPEKFEYPINRYTMEAKRQLDVLNKQLANNKYIVGDIYTIADMAIWPWYGQLVLGRLYDGSAEFLSVDEYPNVIRWAKMLEETRPAVRRGRMVNCLNRDKKNALYADIPALSERHGRNDWAEALKKEGAAKD